MRNENKPVKLIPKNEGLLENALIKETEQQSLTAGLYNREGRRYGTEEQRPQDYSCY